MTKEQIEALIEGYVVQNISGKNKISLQAIKTQLKGIINQEPSVGVKYSTEKVLTEDKETGEKELIDVEKLKSIVIGYYDIQNFDPQAPQAFKLEFHL